MINKPNPKKMYKERMGIENRKKKETLKNTLLKLFCPSCNVAVVKQDDIGKDGYYRCPRCSKMGKKEDFITKRPQTPKTIPINKNVDKKYSDTEINEMMSKFGTTYTPSEIKITINDIIGEKDKKVRLKKFFNAFKNFNDIGMKLRKIGLLPNFTCLFHGVSGTGKTSLARAFAKEYDLPICIIQSPKLVSSLLGDTLKAIRSSIINASDIAKENNGFVLFFDELDAVASERQNNDVGEIKRTVISFLQTLDEISLQNIPLIIIGATNHEDMLDLAVWRRFDYRFKFDYPNAPKRKKIIIHYIEKVKKIGLKTSDNVIEKIKKEKDKITSITEGYTGSDIQRAFKTCIFELFQTSKQELTYEKLLDALKFVGKNRF